ncbi:ABC transporter permease [Rhodosalinus sp. FB01]|uniref:ABC transporter permease n=1 Tax=Rhodosalinus sp. FB01 TaxID=3239194 RepID=UPI003523C524
MVSDASPEIEMDVGTDTVAMKLSGAFTIHTVGAVARRFETLRPDADVVADLGALSRLDTAGAWLLVTLRSRLEAGGGRLEVEGASTEARAILETVSKALPEPEERAEKPATLVGMLEEVGRRVAGGVSKFLGLAGYLGLFLSRLGRSVGHPREFRLTSLVHHCEEVGVKAVPIVALMAFLIGVVLAFQGASQLRQFGAEVFVVDLIAVSILRELGILLTAIIVAGRTGSAFTAAIGSMKMREEVDAMRTLGLDPAMILFVPRILALLLMLPILGLIANLAGLFGGALMAWIELGISPAMFRTRLIEGTDTSHLMVGMVKAPVFALIIGVVGCHAGMQVESNAESLGRQTSKSVVAAIFAVIVADALFSVFFAEIGV